jgi:predicted RNase H-like HicB family nuclease
MEFIAVFERVPEGYIAFAEQFPGANTQGDTLKRHVRIFLRRSS